jgi:hypothetical protein
MCVSVLVNAVVLLLATTCLLIWHAIASYQ